MPEGDADGKDTADAVGAGVGDGAGGGIDSDRGDGDGVATGGSGATTKGDSVGDGCATGGEAVLSGAGAVGVVTGAGADSRLSRIDDPEVAGEPATRVIPASEVGTESGKDGVAGFAGIAAGSPTDATVGACTPGVAAGTGIVTKYPLNRDGALKPSPETQPTASAPANTSPERPVTTNGQRKRR